jgi:hypothetical protein
MTEVPWSRLMVTVIVKRAGSAVNSPGTAAIGGGDGQHRRVVQNPLGAYVIAMKA